MGPFDLLDGWPQPRANAGVLVRKGDVVEVVDSTGDLDAISILASVTKLLTSMAVLAAASDRRLSLEDAAGPPGSTVRHLLSHASGLAMSGREILASPGTRRIYSNSGIEVAAGHLEKRSGGDWTEIVRKTVTGPIGMSSTSAPVGDSAAWSITSTLRDLLELGRELLIPTILSPSELRAATEVSFPGLPGDVPGIGRYEDCAWGLGFEVKGNKVPHWTAPEGSPRTFGHFGRSGAFLWVDPDAGVACACTGGAQFGKWAAAEWSKFSSAVLSRWAPEAWGTDDT